MTMMLCLYPEQVFIVIFFFIRLVPVTILLGLGRSKV